jgi:beta-lactam-binding protein with PASTA domain
MDFREREIDFEEADRRYAELKRQLDAGNISTEEFDAQRKQLMVQDEKGRWWAKGREDGDWYYRGEAGWVKGTPLDYQPPPQTTSPGSTPTSDRNGEIAQTRAATPPLAAREAYERLRKLPWVPILLPLLLLLVLLGSAYALTRGTNENIEVPDLVGTSSVEEAQRVAGGDLEVVEGDGVESQEPIGTVVEQDPAAGEAADEGSTISVDVSKGVSLPDVRGETREEAVRILEGAGFEVEEETEESSTENEGSVTEQDPRGGKAAEAGTSVTITVGAGPADTEAKTGSPEPEPVSPEPKQTPVPEQMPVPDVVGKNVEEAKQTIQNAGFAFAVETVQSNQPAGTVLSTDPAPGTLLDPASRVVIIRQSSGPPPPASNKGADTKTKGGDEKAKGGVGTGKENN